VLDSRCLRAFGEELESLYGALAFLGSYLELLPARLASVAAAVHAAVGAAVMNRALSLKVTSTMVGALQLAAAAGALEPLVCAGDWTALDALLHVLAPAVAAVEKAGTAVVNGVLHP
jgi:hypothetical protein